jgi:uncharacterized Ntn-hydrolase superfamily protein
VLSLSTFSVVACDLARAEWGVAVASKFLAAGSVVPWAEAGVGAVATQAWANVAYGPRGLELMRGGKSAEDVVVALTRADEGREQRQLGVVDAKGGASTFTGAECLEWAGGVSGADYAAQGNILVSEETVSALARTFEASAGKALAARLLDALAAGQRAGGDSRGQQSAALYVVSPGRGYGGTSDVLVDLRVDDHATPIDELERLYEQHDLLFGSTPEDEWIVVDDELARELRERLAKLGYEQESLETALTTWAGAENLEERVNGVARVDPVVLRELRKR